MSTIEPSDFLLYAGLEYLTLDSNLTGNTTLHPLPNLSYTTYQLAGKHTLLKSANSKKLPHPLGGTLPLPFKKKNTSTLKATLKLQLSLTPNLRLLWTSAIKLLTQSATRRYDGSGASKAP